MDEYIKDDLIRQLGQSGSFDGSRAIIEKLLKVGNFSEKQIAGTYLGKQFALATERHDLDATEISRVLNDGKADGEYKVAKILRDRSTQLVGIMIGTAIKTFPDVFTERLVNVPIEGSLFWRMPQYVERTQATAERISGSEINFVNIPYAGRVGAGVAALSFIK